MSTLEMQNITFQVGDKRILDDLSLTVHDSEVHALLGSNGTGKSTLAYLIMGCEGYTPVSGRLIFDGEPIQDLRIHERAQRGIAMAWQEPVRFEGILVRDYLTLKDKDADPSGYLEMVGLAPGRYLCRKVDKSLSGGERKRIELASVLALHPKLAILDEPDSGIDMLSTRDIINVIDAFRSDGSSVLLITHREEIVCIADRASQLCNGRVVCSGNPVKVAEYYIAGRCVVCDKEVCTYV